MSIVRKVLTFINNLKLRLKRNKNQQIKDKNNKNMQLLPVTCRSEI